MKNRGWFKITHRSIIDSLCEISKWSENVKTRFQPVPKRSRVNFDETSTVDKNLGPHVTHCDKLCSVFQTSIVLLQNLHKIKPQWLITLSMLPCTYTLLISSRNAYLEKMWTLPWSQTTHILNQALSVRVCDGSVHIHSNLINTVDELTVKSIEQILLHHMFLRRTREDKLFFYICTVCSCRKNSKSCYDWRWPMIDEFTLTNTRLQDWDWEVVSFEKCLSC